MQTMCDAAKEQNKILPLDGTGDTKVSPGTGEVLLRNVATLRLAADGAMSGQKRTMALIRPPGTWAAENQARPLWFVSFSCAPRSSFLCVSFARSPLRGVGEGPPCAVGWLLSTQ
jgi:hypothetical protein